MVKARFSATRGEVLSLFNKRPLAVRRRRMTSKSSWCASLQHPQKICCPKEQGTFEFLSCFSGPPPCYLRNRMWIRRPIDMMSRSNMMRRSSEMQPSGRILWGFNCRLLWGGTQGSAAWILVCHLCRGVGDPWAGARGRPAPHPRLLLSRSGQASQSRWASQPLGPPGGCPGVTKGRGRIADLQAELAEVLGASAGAPEPGYAALLVCTAGFMDRPQ